MLFESASAEFVAAYVVGFTMMALCGLVALMIARGLQRMDKMGL